MKAAIYCRVSTSEQTNDNQLLELRKYCSDNKYEIVGEYCDIISGTKSSRPQLDLMLRDMRERKFGSVICYKFDRLGRSTSHLLTVLDEMKNKEVRLIATSQNIDTATSMGKFFYTIFAGFAEMEREMLVERVKLGLARARAEGKPIGKRGKDKNQRRKSGYWLRWERQRELATI